MDDSAPELALRCTHLEKRYPIKEELKIWRLLLKGQASGNSILALDDISMDVPRGKIVGILGKNGAGKSTLLRVLGGVYPPTRGQVEVFGQLGGMFEMGGVGNPHITGREYAERYLEMNGILEEEFGVLLQDIIDFSELEEAFDQRIRTYSTGMRSRLYFAVATALKNEIYLIDELLSVGDEHFVAKCWQRMRQRLLNGASGILVTHDWEAVLKLCEYSHVMDQGKIIFSGPSDEAVVSYLNIPASEATVAKLMVPENREFVVRSTKEARLRFHADIFEHESVDLAISIEMLRIGIGWEIVLLKDGIEVGEKPGSYEVEVVIPDFPLAPGVYSLNVFLSRRKITSQDAAEIYDVKSWTVGSGYRLVVEGEQMDTLVKLPFVASMPSEAK